MERGSRVLKTDPHATRTSYTCQASRHASIATRARPLPGPSVSSRFSNSAIVRRATTRPRDTSQNDVSLTPKSIATLRMAVSSSAPVDCVVTPPPPAS
jgi:hypothetical protein